jgi:hypothetical protein
MPPLLPTFPKTLFYTTTPLGSHIVQWPLPIRKKTIMSDPKPSQQIAVGLYTRVSSLRMLRGIRIGIAAFVGAMFLAPVGAAVGFLVSPKEWVAVGWMTFITDPSVCFGPVDTFRRQLTRSPWREQAFSLAFETPQWRSVVPTDSKAQMMIQKQLCDELGVDVLAGESTIVLTVAHTDPRLAAAAINAILSLVHDNPPSYSARITTAHVCPVPRRASAPSHMLLAGTIAALLGGAASSLRAARHHE